MLFEMLAGQQPFRGKTTTDAIAAILEREPDWSALPAATPVDVRSLIEHCLTKDPGRRLRDIGDALPQLTGAGTRAASAPARRAWLPWVIAGGLGVTVLVLGLERGRAPAADNGGFSLERVTTDAGVTGSPSLSADGRLLAYASNRSGRPDLDIWVQQMAGGSPLRITDDTAEDTDPDLSPDGSRLAFRSERGGGGVYLAPALGGPARLVAAAGRRPRFSPDGTRLAYWTGQFRGSPLDTGSATFVLSLAGGAPQRVLAGFTSARDPVWSPDGRALLVLGRRPGEPGDWWHVPLDGQEPTRTGILDGYAGGAVRDDEMVSVGTWDASGVRVSIGGSIWLAPLGASTGRPAGAPRRLVFGAGSYGEPTASRDGTMVFTALTVDRLIQRVALTTADAPATPETLYADGLSMARASPDADGPGSSSNGEPAARGRSGGSSRIRGTASWCWPWSPRAA